MTIEQPNYNPTRFNSNTTPKIVKNNTKKSNNITPPYIKRAANFERAIRMRDTYEPPQYWTFPLSGFARDSRGEERREDGGLGGTGSVSSTGPLGVRGGVGPRWRFSFVMIAPKPALT